MSATSASMVAAATPACCQTSARIAFASIVSTSSSNCALAAAVGNALLATSASLPSVSVAPSQMEAAITAPVLRHTAGATRTFTHSGRSWNERMVINE